MQVHNATPRAQPPLVLDQKAIKYVHDGTNAFIVNGGARTATIASLYQPALVIIRFSLTGAQMTGDLEGFAMLNVHGDNTLNGGDGQLTAGQSKWLQAKHCGGWRIPLEYIFVAVVYPGGALSTAQPALQYGHHTRLRCFVGLGAICYGETFIDRRATAVNCSRFNGLSMGRTARVELTHGPEWASTNSRFGDGQSATSTTMLFKNRGPTDAERPMTDQIVHNELEQKAVDVLCGTDFESAPWSQSQHDATLESNLECTDEPETLLARRWSVWAGSKPSVTKDDVVDALTGAHVIGVE